MYDIVTLEPDDRIVMNAINSIIRGEGAIPGPDGNYRVFVPGDVHIEGDGGVDSNTIIIVGHGSTNSLSGYSSWAAYRDNVSGDVDWRNATRVFLAACSTSSGSGSAFLHGNIANEVRAWFNRGVTVWASSTNVGSTTQSGDWERL